QILRADTSRFLALRLCKSLDLDVELILLANRSEPIWVQAERFRHARDAAFVNDHEMKREVPAEIGQLIVGAQSEHPLLLLRERAQHLLVGALSTPVASRAYGTLDGNTDFDRAPHDSRTQALSRTVPAGENL